MKDITSSVYNFEDLIQGNFLYVDKTEYIWQLIKPAKEMYFLSRPRRFGKSLTVSTLKAVFEGKKELFKGLAIYDKPYDWKPYPVIHLDLNGLNFSSRDEFNSSLCGLVRECAEDHHINIKIESPEKMFRQLIRALSLSTSVVILLDEYDKPILNNISSPEVEQILSDLKAFYSVIKAFEERLRFVFVTGVSKFCHVSLFSDLNNLTDITMDARYATMFGYTQEELEANFADKISAISNGQDIDAFKAKIKEWYNGFRFEENAKTVYNPVSLAKFFESGGKFNNYWFSTGTPSFLMELAKQKNFDFESSLKEPVPQITFNAFEIDNIDPLTLLLQTGYVTIKGTEERFGETWYYLDFPNTEVTSAFSAYILNSYAGKTQTDGVRFVSEFATSLVKNDLKRLRKAMESFFAGIPYDVHKKQEATFQGIFFSVFRLLGVYIEAESETNDGRIDAVVQTSKAIYIFEFKLDNNPTALSQIKEKEYFKKYLLDKRDIYIIGVNFDSVKGNLVGWQDEKLER
ncbi:MAG: ATP-binding protein [Kiritimatiellae bacterium]|nr:ATP-binding protein [Kiritimatiellia bacterium]